MRFDETLSSGPQTLKEYISQYKQKKAISNLKERRDIDDIDIESPNKNLFSNNLIVDIFVFTVAIHLAITTLIMLYILCCDMLSLKLTSICYAKIKIEINTVKTSNHHQPIGDWDIK